jgi:magnesium-transporting ATPase (P-type)
LIRWVDRDDAVRDPQELQGSAGDDEVWNAGSRLSRCASHPFFFFSSYLIKNLGFIWPSPLTSLCPPQILASFSDHEWIHASSADLVPGDVIEIPQSVGVLPCDLALLSGEVIMDESMLTGESVPISKSPARDDDLATLDPYKVSISLKFMLFSGTRVVRSRGPTAGKVPVAVVLRTGMASFFFLIPAPSPQ